MQAGGELGALTGVELVHVELEPEAERARLLEEGTDLLGGERAFLDEGVSEAGEAGAGDLVEDLSTASEEARAVRAPGWHRVGPEEGAEETDRLAGGEQLDDLEHPQLGLGVEAVAALHLGGGDALREKALEAGQGEGDQRVVGGLAHRADGGGDAAARHGDGEVVGAGAAESELVRAVTGPDEVGVGVDEAGRDQAAVGVEDPGGGGDARPGEIALGADPGDVRVLDADGTAGNGPKKLLGSAAVRAVGGEERPGVPDEKVEGAAHRSVRALRP